MAKAVKTPPRWPNGFLGGGGKTSQKKFSKKVEDFVCKICGTKVKGTGYTDHCPNCLFSKHVDVFPGDRRENCGGLMEPIGITKRKGKWQILYHCQKCGHQKFNKIAPGDNQEKITELSRHPIHFN